ncbi:hypothetical protein ACFIOY_36450 [Bradyrhizobium sp. TZ2]
MPFLVQAAIHDHTLAVTTETAKEAFAKAVEWHVVEKFVDVSISDGHQELFDCRIFIGKGTPGD